MPITGIIERLYLVTEYMIENQWILGSLILYTNSKKGGELK